MDSFKTKVKVKKNHKIQIVVITIDIVKEEKTTEYPLWGTSYKYDNPFEPAVPSEE